MMHNIVSAASESAINTATASGDPGSALSTAAGAAVDIPVEAFVAVSDEHKLEASNPDPDALAKGGLECFGSH